MSEMFFTLIPSNASIDFIGKRRIYVGISVVTLALAIIALLVKGLNYGVDFTGGTQIQVRFQSKPSDADVRKSLSKIQLSEATVQEVGGEGSGEFLVRVSTAGLDLTKYRETLQKAFDAVSPAEGGPARLRFSEDRLYVQYEKSADPEKMKAGVNALGAQDITAESVNPFGKESNHEYLVQFAGVASRITGTFQESFGKGAFEILQTDQIGPKVGKELRWQAVGAVLISMILILIYVGFRFEFEFAPGAVLGLFHDAMIVLGVFAFFGLQFDLSIVAAVLTIIGFSINDTIVVYDRIRENIARTRNPNLAVVMNDSINQTLSRTILTSGTVLLATLALVFFGGPITFNFALAFSIGVVVGTYSSISVSSALTLYLHEWRLRRHATA
ncbi:MAG: protein translocase subunit SecF [Pseudomonadota bacterium]